MKRDLSKIGKSAYACIEEMVAKLDETEDRAEILQDAMSCEVRGGWHSPGDDDGVAEEYCLLLATGGPAVRIIGELRGGEPYNARLEVQDWGTLWTEYEQVSETVLIRYAECFYYGDL